MATGTMEDYGVPVQNTRLSLSSMKLLCFEMFPDDATHGLKKRLLKKRKVITEMSRMTMTMG